MCCQVYFGEHKASAGDTKSVDTHTHTLSSIIFHITQQRFVRADSTVRKNYFQHFWMIAASRTNVHQQRSLFRRSFRCVEPRWRGGRVQYVCVESPEVSSPGGCSVAPPSGPERQRRPLLETKTDGFVTSERPRQLTQMSMTAKWKEFQWQLEQHWDQNVFFFCRISWSA